MKFNFVTIFALVSLISQEINESYSDKKVTVGEVMEMLEKIVSALGLENKVLIDNSKE